MISVIDLNFLNLEHSIASFLVKSQEGDILIESGPHSTFSHLSKGLKSQGVDTENIQHVFLTHIHLDHAGAAWQMAEFGANIYMHPFGVPHLNRPEKLIESASRIYKDDMDRLWGTIKGIPEKKIISVEDNREFSFGDLTIKSLHTPGHAKHHIAWQIDDLILAGDVAGVKIDGGPVVPPCPPPDINIEDWLNSIERISKCRPNRLLLTHYGEIHDVDDHLNELSEILFDWSQWIKTTMEAGKSIEEMTPAFTEYTSNQLRAKGVGEYGIKQYQAANPSWMSVAGLTRYWKKKRAESQG